MVLNSGPFLPGHPAGEAGDVRAHLTIGGPSSPFNFRTTGRRKLIERITPKALHTAGARRAMLTAQKERGVRVLMRDSGEEARPRPVRVERRKARLLGPTDVRKLVIADDDSMFRIGLRDALVGLYPKAELIEANNHAALLAALQAHHPDLVLLDPALPGVNGYVPLLILLQRHRNTRFVAVSSVDGTVVANRALALGLAGFVSKRATQERIAKVVVRAVQRRTASRIEPDERRLIDGLHRLTPAELQVFTLLPDNASHRHLMKALDIALPTVKTHMSRILAKLALRNRTEAAIVAKRLSVLNARTLCIDRPEEKQEIGDRS
jgi:DNA-binding NarL/FixJ family response regulator